jgi:hypothetical protein
MLLLVASLVDTRKERQQEHEKEKTIRSVGMLVFKICVNVTIFVRTMERILLCFNRSYKKNMKRRRPYLLGKLVLKTCGTVAIRYNYGKDLVLFHPDVLSFAGDQSRQGKTLIALYIEDT